MVGAAIGVIGSVIGIQIYGPLGAAMGLALLWLYGTLQSRSF